MFEDGTQEVRNVSLLEMFLKKSHHSSRHFFVLPTHKLLSDPRKERHPRHPPPWLARGGVLLLGQDTSQPLLALFHKLLLLLGGQGGEAVSVPSPGGLQPGPYQVGSQCPALQWVTSQLCRVHR